MRILSRYLVARFLALFFATLFASTLAIIIVEMLLNFDDMMAVAPGAGGVATYLFLRIPAYYLRDLVPLAVFAGVFFSLGSAARWLELMAITAGGISHQRAILPVLISAAVIAAGGFVVNETWVIRATRASEQQKTGANQTLDFRRGSFWYHRGQTIYNIRGANREARTLEGVSLFERDPVGRLVRSIHADRVQIDEDQVWHFQNATIRRFDPTQADGSPELEIAVETVLQLGNVSETALTGADASMLSTPRLREYIAARSREGGQVHRMVALLHNRLAEPVGVVLLALLAVPFGVSVERKKRLGQPAVLGMIAVAAFFMARNVAATLASEGVVPAAAAPWGVLMLFGSPAAWRFARLSR